MQKHASWIVALIVGIVAGVLADRTAGGGGKSGGRMPSELPPGSLRESDLPAGTLAGLSDSQKYQVLKGVSEKLGPQRPQARPVEDPKAIYKIPVDDSPVKGPADALVTIVESSDFQCPFCKRAVPTLKQIEQAYPGKVRFVFKHNPLSFHDRAMAAALAAEEARAEGGGQKFWAMHDKLFEAPGLDRASLERAGQEVGLNLGELRGALDSSRWDGRIRRDQALVTALGATGTPTFFINGRKLSGAQPFEAFQAIIDEEIKKAEEMVKAGTPAGDLYARIVDKGAIAPVMIQGAAPQQPPPPPPPPPPAASKVPFRSDDPARGAKNAKVTIVEFSDFQCPFCSRVGPTLKQLEQAYGKDLRIVWKHQPLPFHPNAMPAAEAAEAARDQGKFWQMHDLMFAEQQQLAPAKYEAWARQIGLDVRKFKAAIESHRFRSRIEEDSKLGGSVGASGTPTLFVNCRQIVGAQPYDRFKTMVDDELKKADQLVKKGVKVDGKFYERICEENVKAAGAAPTAAAPSQPAPSGPAQIALRVDDPVKGNPRAPVTIVEFSDFQCPYCSRAEATLRQVEQAYGEKVRFAWKHEPLPMHPNALPAALAAEAAREQGKFWQMHEKLFANQTALSPDGYERWAKEIGLDMGRFRESLRSQKNRARIDEDVSLAQRIGATGTPTFFVNGQKIEGAVPFEQFKQVVDRELQKSARR